MLRCTVSKTSKLVLYVEIFVTENKKKTLANLKGLFEPKREDVEGTDIHVPG